MGNEVSLDARQQNFRYDLYHRSLKEGRCPMIVRWMIEADMAYRSPALTDHPIRMKYFCAFAFGVWPTLVMRIYRAVTESIFILVRLPYRIYLAYIYDLDNNRNPNKPPNTVTEADRLWHKVGHEWVDLWETLRCWGVCGVNTLNPGWFQPTISKVSNYYHERIQDDRNDVAYVRCKIEMGDENAAIRKAWKGTRKLPRPLLMDNISVPGARAPEDIYSGHLIRA